MLRDPIISVIIIMMLISALMLIPFLVWGGVDVVWFICCYEILLLIIQNNHNLDQTKRWIASTELVIPACDILRLGRQFTITYYSMNRGISFPVNLALKKSNIYQLF
jgi:hypothetical protein